MTEGENNTVDAKENIKEFKEQFKSKSKSILSFCKNNALWITLALVIILQFVPNGDGNLPWGGMWMRMQAKDLPIADQWAESTLDQSITAQLRQQINQQYPNLPADNKKKLLDDKLSEFKKETSKEIEKQKSQIANSIRDHYKYESNGEKFVYMPDIDTYFYLRQARNLVEKGHAYDELKDGVPWDNHVLAPFGREYVSTMHAPTMVLLYQIGSLLNSKITLMEAANYFPIVFIFLSLIPVFFIGRRFAGNIGGFFSVTVFAILPAIMSRTPWGHADTDAYNVFFPLVIAFFIVEAFFAKKNKSQSILLAIAGLITATYSQFWGPWSFMFYISITSIILFFFAFLANGLIEKLGFRKENVLNWKTLKSKIFSIIVYLGSTWGIFILISLNNLSTLVTNITKVFRFTSIKQAAHSTLWPNVYTTVAELNKANFNSIINSIGGKFLFIIALIGIFLLIMKNSKNKVMTSTVFFSWLIVLLLTSNVWIFIAGCALMGLTIIWSKKFDGATFGAILMLVWFGATLFASTNGIRFTLLVGPAFAIAFGTAAGQLSEIISTLSKKFFSINKVLVKSMTIAVFLLLLMMPVSGASIIKRSYTSTTNGVPLVNDAWWNILTKIKEESNPNAIVNSWWDFGHHFKYIADRAVTFDGGSQNSPPAHWIGKALQTDNENEAIGILRMLDCGSNRAYDTILNQTDDPVRSVKIVKELILVDKQNASQILDSYGLSQDTLQYTHCQPPENYFITSADMVGKSGVWSHFGLWDFEKAYIWKHHAKSSEEKAVADMMKKFNYSEEKATDMYNEVVAISTEEEANRWISPWPSYQGNPINCKQSDNTLTCGNVRINMTTMAAQIQSQGVLANVHSVVIPDKAGLEEFVSKNPQAKISVIIIPSSNGLAAVLASPELAKSMFTRLFFLNGHSTKHFEKFAEDNQIAQGKISVWKVDWAGNQDNRLNVLKEKTKVVPGATVKAQYIGYFENGTVFDSSLPDWRNKGLTPSSPFTDEFKTIDFVAGAKQMIQGFDEAVIGMKVNETKTFTIPPEKAYGTDPEAHELGNKTLKFKVRITDIK